MVFDAVFVTRRGMAIKNADGNRHRRRFHQRQHAGQGPVGFIVGKNIRFANALLADGHDFQLEEPGFDTEA